MEINTISALYLLCERVSSAKLDGLVAAGPAVGVQESGHISHHQSITYQRFLLDVIGPFKPLGSNRTYQTNLHVSCCSSAQVKASFLQAGLYIMDGHHSTVFKLRYTIHIADINII